MSSTKTKNATTSKGSKKGESAKVAIPASLDQAIAQAQHGSVHVTPTGAVQMAAKLYGEGKYAQAQKVGEQVVSARPGNPDAHNLLGVTYQALGNGEAAIASLKRAVELAPGASNFRANLGEILRQNGKREDAQKELEKAIELEQDNSQALNNLGIIRFDEGKFDEAAEYYRRALKNRPDMAEAHNNLGNVLRLSGDLEGAVSAYQSALTARERYPEAYNNLGTLLQQQKRFPEAEHALRKAIAQNPRYVEAYNNIALLLVGQEKDTEALRYLGDALKFAPKNVQTLLITARIQMRRNNLGAAEQASRLALAVEPENAEALTILGQVFHETDRYEASIEALEKALKANPANPEAQNFYGVALKSVGRLDEARDHIVSALKSNPGMWGAYANLNDLVDFSSGVGEELFDQMQRIFDSSKNHESAPFLPLHYAYGKALEDRGEHERALHHYIVGGKMKRAQLEYNEKETFKFFDSIRKTFSKDFFKNNEYPGINDERPVFIIGMPRSGSTLVEQILSSHPDVYGAGEVKYLSRALGQLRDRFPSLQKYPEMVENITPAQLDITAKNYLKALTEGAGGAKRITDKLLTNYFFVGLIHMMYPRAKFVNTVRNPIDTCLSGFTKLFKDDMPHSYDLGELGRYYCKYAELMEHWRNVLPKGVLTMVNYEDVVADTEKEAKALIEFIALDWDSKCVDFHKSDRPVKTASVAQVRKPIYKSSVERWKKYGSGLQPLIEAVGDKQGKINKSKSKSAGKG